MLVLSELAGAARELQAALIVNPYDIDDVADGLAKAIEMSLEERRERWKSLIKVLRRNDIHRWRRRFLQTLDDARSNGSARSERLQTSGTLRRDALEPPQPKLHG